MNKRHFLTAAGAASLLPSIGLAASASPNANTSRSGSTLLTVAGRIGRGNRGALDPAFDQMMKKHGVAFDKAYTFDAQRLSRLASVNIRPTLEYDAKPHQLSGPLLTTVLAEAGVDMASSSRIQLGLRAVDGYNAVVSLADARSWRMIVATHMDGKPLGLGGLGPLWAVYDADRIDLFKALPLNQRFAQCPWGMYFIQVTEA